MNAIILTEAGESFGFGHLTRCIGLYQGFEEEGFDVEMIVNCDSKAEFLLNGINFRIMNWTEQRERVYKILKNTDIAIIDSYTADLEFYIGVSKTVKTPVYIDDYMRLDYPEGIVVSPSIYGDKLKYPEKNGVKYLLGKDYIILRKEFWDVPEKGINEEVKDVLITFGGGGLIGLEDKISNLLRNKFGLNVTVVNPENKLRASEMLLLMLKSDLCISAGGQTTYELARVGVPTIGICFARNQLDNLVYGNEIGYLNFVGWFDEVNLLDRISDTIEKIDFSMREKMHTIGKKTINGQGVKNIIKTLQK